MSWHMVLHSYSLINSFIDSQIFNNLLLCSGYGEVARVSKSLMESPYGGGDSPEWKSQSTAGTAVLRKVLREKVASKPKQKKLQSGAEMFRAAHKEEEVRTLQLFGVM